MQIVKRIMRFLKGTKDLNLLLDGNCDVAQNVVYSNSGYGMNVDDSKS